MARIHMIITAEPIEQGKELVALCGAVINQANAIPLDDFSQKGSAIFCRKCFNRQYFYAITSGQESKDMEAES